LKTTGMHVGAGLELNLQECGIPGAEFSTLDLGLKHIIPVTMVPDLSNPVSNGAFNMYLL